MAMVVVVPREADLAMGPGVLDGAEALGAVRSVLPGVEVRLAEGVVIAGVGSAVGLGDPQVGEQAGHRLGLPAGAAVGVSGELARAEARFGAGRADERGDQGGGFAGRDYLAVRPRSG